MATRIPPLLEPYLSLPPEATLILLTGTINAATPWLTIQFLSSFLTSSSSSPSENVAITCLSFTRDLSFWKENARRQGLDLEKAMRGGRFGYVDGLGGGFWPMKEGGKGNKEGKGKGVLDGVFEAVKGALEGLNGNGKGKSESEVDGEGTSVLVIDGLDYLLAGSGQEVNAVELEAMLLGLRELVHTTIITLSADAPLVSSRDTPLETEGAAFLLSIAHQADLTMSLRLLDSGHARDVSGVLRVTVGEGGKEMGLEERELLYFVGGDGGVKVFERGQ